MHTPPYSSEMRSPDFAEYSIKSVLIIQYDLLIPRDIERLRQRSAAGIVRAPAPRGHVLPKIKLLVRRFRQREHGFPPRSLFSSAAGEFFG